MTGTLNLPTLGNAVIGGPVDLKKTFRKLTWRLGVDHKFTPDIMVFATYNRGFKSGAYNSSSVDPSQMPIEPELLDAYELGFKTQMFDRAVQLNGSFYFYDYRNIQVCRATFADTSLSLLEAAGAAKLYGFDGEVVVVRTTGLRLNAGVNLAHSKYTKYDNASAFDLGSGTPVAVTIDAKGQRVLGAPDVTFSAGGSYAIPVSADSSLTPSINYSYNSKYKLKIGEGNEVRSFGIVNASIRWERRRAVSILRPGARTSQTLGPMDGTRPRSACSRRSGCRQLTALLLASGCELTDRRRPGHAGLHKKSDARTALVTAGHLISARKSSVARRKGCPPNGKYEAGKHGISD